MRLSADLVIALTEHVIALTSLMVTHSMHLTIDEKKSQVFPSRGNGFSSGLLATEQMDEPDRQGKNIYKVDLQFGGDAGTLATSQYCGEMQFQTILH
jgi:hypothetical protein